MSDDEPVSVPLRVVRIEDVGGDLIATLATEVGTPEQLVAT